MTTSSLTPYEPTWESLCRQTTPTWYLDGKFGIFIHWGVYSVPAFANEWYPRNMYRQGTPEFEHHLKTYGPHNQFGYKDFIPQFSGAKFNPFEWADLFQRAGARFVVPVAEHHDGFAMYDSQLNPWNAARMGPRRDVIGELAAAVRLNGMVFGASSHRAEHWWFMNGGRDFDSDVNDPRFASFYGPATPAITQDTDSKDWLPRPDALYLEDWLARTCELVDRYQPQLVWFDWWIQQITFKPYLQRFAAYYYNRGLEWGKEVAINYKFDAFAEGSAVLDIERGQLNAIRPFFWQNDTAVQKNSWGYTENQDYKTAADLIGDLVDIVSKNGALLLNIGPRADGSIPQEEQDLLLAMGRWLAVNGEAIYGSRPWTVFGEGPTQVPEGSFTDTQRPPYTAQDIRFTTQGGAVYAIALARPAGQWTVHALGSGAALPGRVKRVSLLGEAAALEWRQDADGLTLALPENLPEQEAYTFKVEFES